MSVQTLKPSSAFPGTENKSCPLPPNLQSSSCPFLFQFFSVSHSVSLQWPSGLLYIYYISDQMSLLQMSAFRDVQDQVVLFILIPPCLVPSCWLIPAGDSNLHRHRICKIQEGALQPEEGGVEV